MISEPKLSLRGFFGIMVGFCASLACFSLSHQFVTSRTYSSRLASTALDIAGIVGLCVFTGSVLRSFTTLFSGQFAVTICSLVMAIVIVLITTWSGRTFWVQFVFELPFVTQWALRLGYHLVVAAALLLLLTLGKERVIQDHAKKQRLNVAATKLACCSVTAQFIASVLPFAVVVENM